MSNTSITQRSNARQRLENIRNDIDQLPYRRRIALLHEHEQAEARQSSIELSVNSTKAALKNASTRSLLDEIPGAVISELYQTVQSLKQTLQNVEKQLDES